MSAGDGGDLVELVRHGAQTLTAFKARCARNGVAPPGELESLRLALLAWDRQAPTGVDGQASDGKTVAMTYEAVAQQLVVSKRSVERLVAAGTLPSVDVAGSPRVLTADLDAYVASLRSEGSV